MRLIIIVTAVLMVFIGTAVYVKNQREGQRQVEFHAMQPATMPKTTDPPPSEATEDAPGSAQQSPQTANPDALMGLKPESTGSNEQTLVCELKTAANLQRCFTKNNIQNGSEEAYTLIALARRGRAEFLSVPHESGGKCYTHVKITGNYNGKDIDRLLKDCEVD